MPDRMQIVVASQNPGKCRELARILETFEVLSLADFPRFEFPEEGGDYHENVRVKARTAARETGLACVADDSGLEVECLGGAPGAYSARYGGEGLDDRGRIEYLLEQIGDADAPRKARFFCAAACAWPDGRFQSAEGTCDGEILLASRGEDGFGYDPIFLPEGEIRAMAELSRDEKDRLSHRGRAIRALAPLILGARKSPGSD